MKRFHIVCTFVLVFFVAAINAQDFNNFYPDNLYNDIAGYNNAVYHHKSSSYFLVKYARQLNVSFNSALHVKKVDEFGNLITERYFVTDFMPYSGHYISGVQVQGEELVVFVNRNVGYPHVHDVFIIRIKLDLSGTPTSKRMYLSGTDKQFNSIKVNEVVNYGNQLLFTGSVLTRGDLNNHADNSKLLMGLVNTDGSITYQIYQHNADLLEGLSLLPRAKAGEAYVSIRYTEKKGKAINYDLPAIFKFQIIKNSFYVNWGELYPDLRVDVSNYSSYNEGIEIPLMESFTEKSFPAFFARDFQTEELVFVPFSRITGDPEISSVRKFNIPEGVELIDAIKLPGTKNGIAALFTRKEPYNLVNSESYLLTSYNVYSTFFNNPRWRNLTSPSLTNAIQARRILIPGKYEVAVAGLVNNTEYPLSGLYRSSLMKTDDLTFDCVTSKKLVPPKGLPLVSKKILLKLSYVPVLFEDREMEFSTSVTTSTYELCGPMFTEDEGVELRSDNPLNAADIQAYPNPANDQITIEIPYADTKTNTVLVRNMMGMIVHRVTNIANASTININTSEFADGVYFVEVLSSDNEMAYKRIVIAH